MPSAIQSKKPPKRRRKKIGPAQVKRQNERLAAYIAAKEAARLAAEASGYNPLNPGYDSTPTPSTPPAEIVPGLATYQPTPKDELARPATPTPGAKTTLPRRPHTSAAKALPGFLLDELFDGWPSTTRRASKRQPTRKPRSPAAPSTSCCDPQSGSWNCPAPRFASHPSEPLDSPRTQPRVTPYLDDSSDDTSHTTPAASYQTSGPFATFGTRYLGSPGKPRPAPRPRAHHRAHPYRV